MSTQHVVVDGSNIATEGRSMPSLSQLEGAVAEIRREMPDAEMTVVVDATFAHRIDAADLERFEAAALRGEYVYPPAGAIGRGDAFLLRIAERVEGIVLSNDSFQEFHGEHEWLFDKGRLLGATPVPGVGWIFVPRTPVRGPRSRVAVRDAHRAKDRVVKAIAQATKEVVEPDQVTPRSSGARRSRTRTPAVAPQAVNDPMTFISFIAEHPLGEEIEGLVDSFTSHGAVVHFGDVRCYVPLSGLGQPAPRAAREVLQRGERRGFVVTALDPLRRGVELALPGVAVVSGRPSDETVAAEVRMSRATAKRGPAKAPAAPKIGATRAGAAGGDAAKSGPTRARAAKATPAAAAGGRTGATKVTPTKAAAAKAAPTKAAPTKASPTRAAAGRAGAAKPAAAAKTAASTPAARPKIGDVKKAPAATSAAKAAPAKAVAGRAAPAKAAPTKAVAGRTGAAKAAPAKATADRAAPTKAAPTQAVAGRAGAAKAAPSKATAGRTGVTRTAGAAGASSTKAATARAGATKSASPAKAAAGPRSAAARQPAKSTKAAKVAAPAKAAGDAKPAAGSPAAGSAAAGTPRRSPAKRAASGLAPARRRRAES